MNLRSKRLEKDWDKRRLIDLANPPTNQKINKSVSCFHRFPKVVYMKY